MMCVPQVAQLALKHRQNKNQRQRIVCFVGSPVEAKKEELGMVIVQMNVVLACIWCDCAFLCVYPVL